MDTTIITANGNYHCTVSDLVIKVTAYDQKTKDITFTVPGGVVLLDENETPWYFLDGSFYSGTYVGSY